MKTKTNFGIEYDKKIKPHGGEVIGVVERSAFTITVSKGWYGFNGESVISQVEFTDGCLTGGPSVKTDVKGFHLKIEKFLKKMVAKEGELAILQMDRRKLGDKISPLQKERSEIADLMFKTVKEAKGEN